MVAATNTLLSGLRVVRPHLSRGHRFPTLFVVLLLPISILGTALFLHNSQDHQSPNSNPDLDVYKIPIPWNKLNQTQMASVKRYINNQTEVAFTLMKQLFSTEAKGKNTVFSPLSIHTFLSLIAAGSKDGTREQLLAFLKSKSTQELGDLASTLAPLLFAKGCPSGGPNLTFANGVWIDQSLAIKPSFKQVVEMAYKASLKQVDFKSKPDEVRIEVNSWAEKQTNGLIKDILPPDKVDSLTRLILANALYFKGAWENRFDESQTIEENFNLFDGSSVKTPFMTSWVTSWGRRYIGVFEGFKVLKLPYERDRDLERSFSMYVFLPNERDGLPALAERLASDTTPYCVLTDGLK